MSSAVKGAPVSPDPRPLVAKGDSRLTTYLIAAALGVAAIWLFFVLENARQQRSADQASAEAGAPPLDLTGGSRLPELVLPASPEFEPAPVQLIESDSGAEPASRPQPTRYNPQPSTRYSEPPPSSYTPPNYVPPSYPAAPLPGTTAGATANAPTSNRVMAGKMANPAYTIVQGTLISAVLETALDSTRPGQARAMVTKDVMSFDGERVLIPRGSRIFGTYQSEVNPGQKRILIRWARLLTPEGVSVDLDSPSADPLGRAGLRGDVDNHTLRRIGDALLNSVVELGGIVVGNEVGTNPVVVLPGGSVNNNVNSGSQITPTIKVKQGERVTVFVATDLDFSLVTTR